MMRWRILKVHELVHNDVYDLQDPMSPMVSAMYISLRADSLSIIRTSWFDPSRYQGNHPLCGALDGYLTGS